MTVEQVRVIAVDETASTNALALKLAAGGEQGPVWVTARRQVSGRGRSGRAWVSLDGNLHATLLISPKAPLFAASQLSLVAGVAAAEAVASVAGGPAAVLGLRLKWPNDILIGGAKCGGILIESSSGGPGGALSVAVGIGLNLAAAPEMPDRRVTHLALHGVTVTPETMLAELAAAMAHWLARWDDARGFTFVREAWLRASGPIGEPVTVNAGTGPVSGRFAGLDETGALIVTVADGKQRRFTFGDVTLLDGTPGAHDTVLQRVPGARMTED